MLKVVNYFIQIMGTSTILVWYFATLNNSTKLLSQKQAVIDKAYAVTKNIGVDPQLIPQSDSKNN